MATTNLANWGRAGSAETRLARQAGQVHRAQEESMSQSPEELEEPQPPRGHVRVIYLGPVAPHWEIQSEFGERALIEEFRQRTLARLVLLPPHDPQFRRNRERVVRDAERENLILDWDLGIPEIEEPDERA